MDENVKVPWPGWKVIRRLGKGSFGAVYEIERDQYGITECSAMKVMTIPRSREELEQDYSDGYDDETIRRNYERQLQNVLKEYRLMASLKGENNIVFCEDVHVDEAPDDIRWDIYFKMELLQPLDQMIKGRDMTEAEVIKLGKDICNALIACDDIHVIHRDIKPGNILVTKNGNFKLGDFGIARTVTEATQGTLAGAERYMAPEIVRHEKYGKEVDIYSLGIVMYYLMNRKKMPFYPLDMAPTPEQREKALYRRLSGERLENPIDASNDFAKVILKACAYDRKERYQSAKELLTDLENIEDDGTVTVRIDPPKPPVDPPTPPVEPPKPPVDPPNNPIVPAVLGVAAVAALCFGGGYAVKKIVIPEMSYNAAIKLETDGKYQDAISKFEDLDGYRDSEDHIKICQEEIDKADNEAADEADYNEAISLMEAGQYEEAISIFEKLKDYKDSEEQIEICKEELDKAANEAAYNEAIALKEAGKYEDAISIFEKLKDYKDSEEQIKICKEELDKAAKIAEQEAAYNAAVALMESENYAEAKAAFNALNGYRDSAELAQECQNKIDTDNKEKIYLQACQHQNDGYYEEAIGLFETIADYSDASNRITQCNTLMSSDDGFTGHTYELFNMNEYSLKNWEDIVAFCKNRGGNIASINSARENQYLYDMVKDAGYKTAFFGYTDRIQEGNWIWEGDSGNTYSNWAPGQPNNCPTDKHPEGEDYAQFAKDRSDGTWYDLYLGGNSKMFICEWGPTDLKTTVYEEVQIFEQDISGFTAHDYMLYDMNALGLSSWDEIVAFCKEKGGHIAVIDSMEENNYLLSLVRSAGHKTAFFGYTDREQEGVWKWEGAPENTFSNWAPGQPNNTPTDKHPEGENYAQFAKDLDDGTWYDLFLGGNSKIFICEWE